MQDELIKAAKAGASDLVAAMLDSDPSLVDTRDQGGWTALCHAAFGGHIELVQALIGRGADVRLNQPIHYAGQRGHREVCRVLVEAGAIDHLVDAQDAIALSAYRAMYGYDAAKLGQLLREHPRIARVRQNNGSTLLHEAAANGAVEIMRGLMDAGVEIDARNNDGQTALERALGHNQIDAARQLIDRGAACDVFAAASCGAVQRLGQMLDSDPSLANSTDSRGLSVLRTAMMLGQKAVVRLLLERGAADPAGLARQFCDGKVFDNQKLAGTLFRNVNLAGSVFQNVNLRDSTFHYLDLRGVSIDYAGIDGLRIFGVEVAPLVEAELAKRRANS